MHLWYMLSLDWPERVLSELLYVDDFILMNEAILGLAFVCAVWYVDPW